MQFPSFFFPLDSFIQKSLKNTRHILVVFMTKLKECHPKSEITELQLDTEFRQAFTYCNQFN